MSTPQLKLYSEVKQVFDEQKPSMIRHIIVDHDVADEFIYHYRWELFDSAFDDELIFDYNDVEDIQDYAYRYLEEKLNET